MDKYHPLAKKIKDILDKDSLWYESFEHEPVRTSEEAAKIRTGYTLNQGAKAIIVRVKERGEKKFIMLVVPGNRKFDAKKVRKLGLSDLRFATEAEVSEVTEGVLPGGVPPFGNLFGLSVFADKRVVDNEKIIFNAGDRSFSIAMFSKDYLNIVNPVVTDISSDE